MIEGNVCPRCGIINRSGAKFCQNCRTPLASPGGTSLPRVHPQDNQLRKESAALPPKLRQPPINTVLTGVSQIGEGVVSNVRRMMGKLKNELDSLLNDVDGTAYSAPTSPTGQNPQTNGTEYQQTGVPLSAAPTIVLPLMPPPHAPGTQIGDYYTVLKAWSLKWSNYYKVRHVHCSQGHSNPPTVGETCMTCRAELKSFLIRDSMPNHLLCDEGCRQHLIEISRMGTPGIIKHVHIFEMEDHEYVVSEYPVEPWQTLSQVSLPIQDPNLVVAWCLSVGQGLAQLSGYNYVLSNSVPIVLLLELLILTSKGTAESYKSMTHTFQPSAPTVPQQIGIADLTPFAWPQTPLSPAGCSRQREISTLGQLLFTLTTGNVQRMYRAQTLDIVPIAFRNIINRVCREQYSDLGAMLVELKQCGTGSSVGTAAPSELPVLPDAVPLAMHVAKRGLRQSAGFATDVGRKRDHNEDYVGKFTFGMQQAQTAPEMGLYVVSDGMGGHQAGEKASAQAVFEVMRKIILDKSQVLQFAPRLTRSTVKLDETMTPGEILKEAILEANRYLFQARQAAASDRGTTITAAFIVGEACAIANVGDSRTYLLHNNTLSQITKDHSLVASLVAANMIKPEEVRSHPNRNKIFRTLGEKPSLEVDLFALNLVAGDRLLLCCDGLWEMVLDQVIEMILIQASSPQMACDRLIEAANQAGGEDNISVVTVWIE